MAAVAFDTLKFVNKLEAVGVSRPQAVAEAEVLSEIFDLNLRNLATKEDLVSTTKDLQHEISNLRKDMEARFIAISAEMSAMKWILGVATAGIIALVVKTFF